MRAADREVLVVGRVTTMEPSHPTAEAVVVRGDRIAFVGSLEEARSVAPAAQMVDAGGSVLPGFHDAHIHPLHGGLAKLQCGLHEAAGPDEYRELIRTYSESHPDRPWIVGSGWAMDAFPGGNPRREDLDAIVPDRPVALTSRDVHSLWVNSRALEIAGIDSSTTDPADGVIVRGVDGYPSGTLHEDAMDLVQRVMPEPGPREMREALMLAQRELHSLGIVSWQDAWVGPPTLDCYLSAARDKCLTTSDVVLSLLWDRERDASQLDDLREMREVAEREGLRASTVKIFLDGIVESFTALLLEPYLDAAGRQTAHRGMELVPREQLLSYAALLDRAGFQLHFHAIGDGAVRLGLDVIEAARTANGPRDARHHVSHIQVVHPTDIPRFAELDATANAQPLWAYLDDQMRNLNVPFLGPERTKHQYPFASLLRAGARLAMGSDWPVSSPDPLLEMEVAVRRSDPDSSETEAFLPEEALSIDQALTGFTTNSAFVNHLDDSGRLVEGMRADVVVLDRDIHSIEGSRLSEANVVLTIANGWIVHQA